MIDALAHIPLGYWLRSRMTKRGLFGWTTKSFIFLPVLGLASGALFSLQGAIAYVFGWAIMISIYEIGYVGNDRAETNQGEAKSLRMAPDVIFPIFMASRVAFVVSTLFVFRAGDMFSILCPSLITLVIYAVHNRIAPSSRTITYIGLKCFYWIAVFVGFRLFLIYGGLSLEKVDIILASGLLALAVADIMPRAFRYGVKKELSIKIDKPGDPVDKCIFGLLLVWMVFGLTFAIHSLWIGAIYQLCFCTVTQQAGIILISKLRRMGSPSDGNGAT
jgi:hypothetical protein